MNGCFDNQLPAVVFDGVKTSRMLSCQRRPSVATWEGWHHWRGEGCTAWVVTGQWSTTPNNPYPRHPSRHPARVHRQCWITQCELRAFVLFLELFVLIGNRRLFGTDYQLTDNRPVRYRYVPIVNNLWENCYVQNVVCKCCIQWMFDLATGRTSDL